MAISYRSMIRRGKDIVMRSCLHGRLVELDILAPGQRGKTRGPDFFLMLSKTQVCALPFSVSLIFSRLFLLPIEFSMGSSIVVSADPSS